MRIAQVAPPFETVPPSHYGGTERVIAALTEQLVRRGHDVTLFAAGDSRTSARLVPTVERALWHRDPPYRDFAPFWAITVDRVAERLEEFDVVHSHLDYFGYPLARFSHRPVLTTLHGQLDLPELVPLYEHFDDVPLVSISHAQRRPIPSANWIATVYNGIDVRNFTFTSRPGAYLVFLGRISPDKGLDVAVRVARRAGLPLKIAARPPLPFKGDLGARVDWEYFEEVVKPLLRDSNAEMIGEVCDGEKDGLLGGAAALLFPVHWPEPFGLVMAEAMACGTPVLALRHGSVPEVVEHGVTGFVCDTEDELVAAVARLHKLSRARCRQEAEQRFSAALMAAAYEQVYARLVLGSRTPTIGASGTLARTR
jgi:glycosyltransferase involved in cell wall biosynthesis